MAGKLVVTSVFDADARLEDVGRENLARAYLLRIKEVIEVYRRVRQPKVLLRHTGQALAATIALFLFLFAGRKVLRRAIFELERRYTHRIREIGIQGLNVLPAERMWHSVIGGLKVVAVRHHLSLP